MNNDNLIDKIIDSQDIKTVQLNFRNDTLTEQEFTLFDTNTLTQTEENITYNIPNGTIEYVDDLPINTTGAIYIPLVNKIYTGTQYSGAIYGLYIKNLNDNSVVSKYTYYRFGGFLNNTNNDILYVYSVTNQINYPSWTYSINLINTTTDEIIASYNCPILDIFKNDNFVFCETSNCIYYLTDVGTQLYRFDCSTNIGSILDITAPLTGSGWIQYSSVNNKVYVSCSVNSFEYGIAIINPITNEIENIINLSPNTFSSSLATTFCSFNNCIYLFENYGNLYIFNCNNNTINLLFNVNPSYLYISLKNIIYNQNNNQVYLVYSDSFSPPFFTGNFIVNT